MDYYVAINRRFSFLVSLSLSFLSHGRIPYRGTYGSNLLTAQTARREQYVARAIKDGRTGTRSITRGFYPALYPIPRLTKTTRERAVYSTTDLARVAILPHLIDARGARGIKASASPLFMTMSLF